MTADGAERIADIVIVASGVLITLLIAAALLYWIGQEWRGLDAEQRRELDAAMHPQARENGDSSPPAPPPES